MNAHSTVRSFGPCGTTLHPRKEHRPMQRKSFKYRICPTKKQAEALQWTLARCRELYNASLQERRDAYEVIKHRPDFYDLQARKLAIQAQNSNYYSQANQLPD